jgi:hypothetical protein
MAIQNQIQTRIVLVGFYQRISAALRLQYVQPADPQAADKLDDVAPLAARKTA